MAQHRRTTGVSTPTDLEGLLLQAQVSGDYEFAVLAPGAATGILVPGPSTGKLRVVLHAAAYEAPAAGGLDAAASLTVQDDETGNGPLLVADYKENVSSAVGAAASCAALPRPLVLRAGRSLRADGLTDISGGAIYIDVDVIP